MDIIYFKKSGLFIKVKKEFIPIDATLSSYLKFHPKIDKDFTVENVMQILKNYETEIDNLFISYTKGFKINPFFEEIQLPVIKEEKSNISKILFSWVGSIENYNEFGKPKFEISERVEVSGKIQSDKNSYSLSFIHLNEIKNATFKLNKKIKYSYYDYGEIWEENRKIKKKTFFKGKREFTFEDIIGCFLNEISYFGYPEDTDAVADKIEEKLVNLDTSETTSFDEMQLEWKRKFLKEINKKPLTKKNILRIEKLQKEINYLESKIKNK